MAFKIVDKLVASASMVSAHYKSSSSDHVINGFVIDGDYKLQLTDKSTGKTITENVIHNVVPPMAAPLAGDGIPTLVNTDNTFYIWTKKPAKYAPCWFRWAKDGNLTIVDMITGEKIGRGMLAPSDTVVAGAGGQDNQRIMEWGDLVSFITSSLFFIKLSSDGDYFNLIQSSDRFLIDLSSGKIVYYICMAHGGPDYFLTGNGNKVITTNDIGLALAGHEGPILSICLHCSAMDRKDEPSWSTALTKNQVGHFAIGLKNVGDNPSAFGSVGTWIFELMQAYSVKKSVPDAFETSVARVPKVAQIVALYQGTESSPQVYNNVVITTTGPGIVDKQTGFYVGQFAITAQPKAGYVTLWTVNDVTDIKAVNRKEFNVTSPLRINVSFVPVRMLLLTVTVIQPEPEGAAKWNAGTTSLVGVNKFKETAYNIPFTARANKGYRIKSITVRYPDAAVIYEPLESENITVNTVQVDSVPADITVEYDFLSSFQILTINDYPDNEAGWIDVKSVPPLFMDVGGWNTPRVLVCQPNSTLDMTARPQTGWVFKFWGEEPGITVSSEAAQSTKVTLSTGKRTLLMSPYFAPYTGKYQIEFSGFIANNGMHITIKNNAYNPFHRSNFSNDRPANNCQLSFIGSIILLKGWSRYFNSYLGWIEGANSGPYKLQVAWNSNYPNGIMLPAPSYSYDYIIPWEDWGFTLVGYSSMLKQWIESGYIKADWQSDVSSAVLNAKFTYGLQGNVTSSPRTSNSGITIVR
jgi:hypothetical protein